MLQKPPLPARNQEKYLLLQTEKLQYETLQYTGITEHKNAA